MRRVRRRRKARRPSRHISISATDAEWDAVRSKAERRGLSIARYLLMLVERDASEEDAGLRHEHPALALAKEEQWEQLEAVREVRALMLEGEDAGLLHERLRHECPLVRDMQERIAVMFAAWASAMIAAGRSEELHAAFVRVLGEERARLVATSVAASVAVSTTVLTAVETDAPAAKQEGTQAREGRKDSRQDRLL